MMKRSIRAGVLSSVVGLLCALSSVAMAQTPDETFYFSGRHYSPLDYYLEGPPDTGGCVQNCARDLSPCDPPLFKKADGRCKNSDSN